jgi:hypothetical protein
VARVVYSIRMMDLEAVGPGTFYSVPVPDGFVWVIRCMDATLRSVPFRGSQGFNCGFFPEGGNACGFWSPQGPFNRTYVPYHWEGHAVLQEGDYLFFQCYEAGWDMQASGYQLTLP